MTQFLSSPAEAEQAFYDAFRNLDIAGMQLVWADLPEVYCVHPSGQLLLGYEPVIRSWTKLFQGVEKPQIRITLSSASQGYGWAVRLIEERIGTDAMPQKSLSQVLATNVFVLTDQGWRLFSHHASASATGVKPSVPQTQLH